MKSNLKIHSLTLLYILYFILFSFQLSCTNDKVIDENKFVKIYADLVIVQDTLNGNKTVFDSVKEVVFKKYDVSQERYDSTINYYNRDVKRWENFFNKASAHIETLKSKNQK
jgi:Domain of unknown function (DUF4296)